MVRYADDFVVLVDGTREQAEAEKLALAEFLKTELRMELSMEKTGVTDVREGFDFLGYRVVAGQSAPHGALGRQALHTEGQAERPASQDQGHGERHPPPGSSLRPKSSANLNPLIVGWRNYYRYAIRAYREFSHP